MSERTHPGERVLKDVEFLEDGCWISHRTPSQHYAVVWDSDRHNNIPAHVAVYEHLVGPVPRGRHLHHRCEQARCVNPKHVRPLTAAEHNRLHKTQTHCIRGHELTSENTIVGKRQRYCRLCQHKAQQQWRCSKRHPCIDCGTIVSIRALRCSSCHAKNIGLGTRIRGNRSGVSPK